MLNTFLDVLARKVDDLVEGRPSQLNFIQHVLMATFWVGIGASFGNFGVVETTNLQFAFQQVETKGPETAQLAAACLPKLRHDLVSLCNTVDSGVAKAGTRTLAHITSTWDCAPLEQPGQPERVDGVAPDPAFHFTH